MIVIAWWEKNNMRLIQNNIRDTDAELDADKLIEILKDLSANTLMLNTGGLMAFYPTELEFQYKSPYLKKDLVGEMLEKCHKNNIKYIARFDFSKAHYSIFKKHPEWFYKSKAGEAINYNEMVHTCVNGYFQREYSLKIIEEVLKKYAVDGIFFNMFGYQTGDYSGNYYGICNCENCKKRFKEMFNEELPEKENINDEVYKKYIKFKEITTKELLDNIYKLVKDINNEISISTYTHHKVDMIRKESNSAVDRAYPIWLYSASENVKSVEDTWENKIISNCVINAVDIFYRFVGVSKYLTEMRLYESIASGSGLDFCIIGVFEDYPDEDNFDKVKEIFEFHKKNEKYYGNFKSMADVAIIKPYSYAPKEYREEYLGIFKMLKEQHIIFDVICHENLQDKLNSLEKYKCIVIPDHTVLFNEEFTSKVLDRGINIIATNLSLNNEGDNTSKVYEFLGGSFEKIITDTRSAYLLTDNKEIFKRFPKRDWVFIDKKVSLIKYENHNKNMLPYIAPARFGPPERCGGHSISNYFGASLKYGKGKIISIPWEVGYLYYKYGYEDHKNILLDLLDYAIADNCILTTNAPVNVEIFLNSYDNGDYILQLLNLSGFNGTTFYEPNIITGIDVSIRNIPKDFSIKCLTKDQPLKYEHNDGLLTIHIDKLNTFEALIIKRD